MHYLGKIIGILLGMASGPVLGYFLGFLIGHAIDKVRPVSNWVAHSATISPDRHSFQYNLSQILGHLTKSKGG